jgi:hypothetical protein
MSASMRQRGLVTLFFVVVAVLASCDDNTPVCVPAEEVRECICRNGQLGQESCRVDGLGYGACNCAAGPRTDAGANSTGGQVGTGGQGGAGG